MEHNKFPTFSTYEKSGTSSINSIYQSHGGRKKTSIWIHRLPPDLWKYQLTRPGALEYFFDALFLPQLHLLIGGQEETFIWRQWLPSASSNLDSNYYSFLSKPEADRGITQQESRASSPRVNTRRGPLEYSTSLTLYITLNYAPSSSLTTIRGKKHPHKNYSSLKNCLQLSDSNFEPQHCSTKKGSGDFLIATITYKTLWTLTAIIRRKGQRKKTSITVHISRNPGNVTVMWSPRVISIGFGANVLSRTAFSKVHDPTLLPDIGKRNGWLVTIGHGNEPGHCTCGVDACKQARKEWFTSNCIIFWLLPSNDIHMLYTFDVDLAVIYTIHVYICRIYLGRGALESVFCGRGRRGRWRSDGW